MNTAPEASVGNNACDTLLHDLNRGRVMTQLNESFTDLVKDVRRLGKAGTLTLTLKIAPAENSRAERVNVTAAIAAKAPIEVPYSGVYFTTEDGRVQKNDPDQAELTFQPLPVIAAPSEPVRIAESAS
jgi:hypothetical protein